VIVVRPYGRRRFALYEDGLLLAVCCYRKGAEAVKERIEQLTGRIAELEGESGLPRQRDDLPQRNRLTWSA